MGGMGRTGGMGRRGRKGRTGRRGRMGIGAEAAGVIVRWRMTDQDLGPPSLKVAGLQLWVHGRQFPEARDADDGNWLRVTGRCGASGASIWVQGAILTVNDIERFGRECQSLYDGKSNRASLDPIEPELRIALGTTDRVGHMSADVEITPDHLAQTHRMRFNIDQSYLPEIIAQCAAIVRSYPVRGRTDSTEP
jgi:hypothetical protein